LYPPVTVVLDRVMLLTDIEVLPPVVDPTVTVLLVTGLDPVEWTPQS